MNVTLDLATIDREDLPQLRAWRNDWRIWRYTRQNDLINEISHHDWFERQAKDPSIRMYKLVMKSGGTTATVGVCGLTGLDFANRRAEFSLYVAPAYHKRGLGRMGLKLLLDHGFLNLGLNVIWGESFDGNPAIKMFELLGMVREGSRRQFYWKDGRFLDAHLFSMTRDEYVARYGAVDSSRVSGDGHPSESSSGTGVPVSVPQQPKKRGRRPKLAAVIDVEKVEPADGQAQAEGHK